VFVKIISLNYPNEAEMHGDCSMDDEHTEQNAKNADCYDGIDNNQNDVGLGLIRV